LEESGLFMIDDALHESLNEFFNELSIDIEFEIIVS